MKQTRRNPAAQPAETVVLVAEDNPVLDAARTTLVVTQMITFPVAIAVSYSRNQSIGWAFVHSFIPIPYLIYAAITPRPGEAAKKNPLGVSGKTLGVAVGGTVAVASASWLWYRYQQRAKLVELLTASPMVAQALAQLLVSWTVESKAASLVGYTNFVSADAAYVDVLAELRKLLPADPEEMLNLSDDAKRMFEEKTGINVDESVAAAKDSVTSVYEKLPDVPLVDTTSWFTSWIK